MKHIITLILLLSTGAGYAQIEANAKFNLGEYEAAAQAYLSFNKEYRLDSAGLYNLAYSLMQTNKYEEAIRYYSAAKSAHFPTSFVDYNIAKSYALLNKRVAMINQLNTAAEAGLSAYTRLLNDSVFYPYSTNEDFITVLNKVKNNAYPCLTNQDNRHFDFWLGEWEVMVNERKVGENSITMAVGGCAIHESYTTAGNYAGQSINYYDRKDQKWHQTWVGSAGGVLDYIEIDKGPGMLQFQCDFLNQQGQMSYSRLTFTRNEDGSVRQLFENSTDGKQWSPGFDGHYIRSSKK